MLTSSGVPARSSLRARTRPGDGRDQVVAALDRLDVAAGLTGLDRFAEVGQGHLDHVAEGPLREIGHPDAHQAAASTGANHR
jgi:hypothetical protein